jgi:hypothetical protein
VRSVLQGNAHVMIARTRKREKEFYSFAWAKITWHGSAVAQEGRTLSRGTPRDEAPLEDAAGGVFFFLSFFFFSSL